MNNVKKTDDLVFWCFPYVDKYQLLPFIRNLLTPVWPDRDDFIRVHEENIKEEMKSNFVKRPYGDAEFGIKGSVDTEHSPYDALSAQKF